MSYKKVISLIMLLILSIGTLHDSIMVCAETMGNTNYESFESTHKNSRSLDNNSDISSNTSSSSVSETNNSKYNSIDIDKDNISKTTETSQQSRAPSGKIDSHTHTTEGDQKPVTVDIVGTSMLIDNELTPTVQIDMDMSLNDLSNGGRSQTQNKRLSNGVLTKYNFQETFTTEGEYKFSLNVNDPNIPYLAVDKHISYLTVSVKKDNGKLKATVIYSGDQNFVSVYKCTCEVMFKARKVVHDSDGNLLPVKDREYSFVLLNEYNQVKARVTNNGVGDVIFPIITYSKYNIGKVFKYRIKEIKGNKSGIIYDERTINVTVKIRENTNDSSNPIADVSYDCDNPEFINTVKKDVGSVVLTKTDEKTKELLKGAEFSLQDSEGKTIKEKVVTDEHGTIRVNDLTPGNYQFTETKAPKGYVINTIPIKFVIKANQKEVVTINMTNKKDVGSVVLTKTDEKTKELLKGAEFSLQDSEGKTIKEKVVTDEHGTIRVNDLTPGNYQFTETKAPKGYVINTIPIKFVIKANQKEVVTINMTNKKDVGSVVLTKTDEKTKELLKGAEFSLQDSEGKTIKEKVVTDEHGTIRVNDLTPGNYQFTETKAPKGYAINTIPIKFVIKENQKEVVTINMTNKKDVGSVVLTKTDEKTKELLKGAEFSLQDSEGKTIKEKVVTDEHGTIRVNDLTPGNYQFTETKAPKGYVINTIPIKFVIKANQKEVVTINMTNKKDVGSVVLTKTDEKTKELLKGAEFSLQDSEGKTIKEKVVTDEHGTIRVNDLTPGNYQFTETKAPKGYVINTIPIKFVIKANQKEVVTINMTNKKDVGSVVLTKTDEKTKELLKGAEFSLQDSEGKTIKEKVVTDEHGTIRVNDLTPGNYQFTETKAPKGYVINTIPIKFVIKANQKEVVTINMTNKKDVGSVVLTKTDEKTKELLKGAEFSLQDSEGKTIKEKVVTDEHGTIRVNDLTPGNYQFTETKAPKGYAINTIPIKFVIKENQKEVVTINMTNKKDVGSVVLTKTDEKTKELLKGAEFSLQDSEGKTIKEKVVTDEHGTIRVNDLTPGNYQFTETKAPKGYVINTIPIKFVIKANQKEVVTINMTNKKDVGSVVLTKTDEKTKELLKGAEFSLQDSEGKTIKEKVVTDEHGTIRVNDLTPGNYQFTETKAPKGYVINTIPIKFVIKANQKEVVTINMTNKKDVGSVVLTKTDEKTKELLKGAEFSLQDSEGKTIKEKVVTDEHGTIRVNDLTPGNYQFTETKAPKGYVINTIPIKFVIKANQKEVVTINMTNKKDVGSVVLTKTDEKTKELLKGAEFSLQDSEGKTIKEKVVTDEHGTIRVNDLTPGNYQFTETKAPKGYVINTIPIKFVIKANQKEVVTINMTNKKDVGSVVLTKTDEKTKELLKGAEFSLQDSEGKTIKEKVVTDEHGTIRVNDLTPGNYQFTETKAPKGYVINTIPIKFVIKANQKEVVTINMTNKKDVGSVVLTKTDEKTKELLKGAEFSLQDSEGKTIKEKVVTDEHGTIRVNDLTPGNYQFTETKAPKGYVINTIPIKFVIKANQKEVVTINMTNKKDVGSVVLTKTDEKTKELLKGAEFSLQDSEGKTIKEKVVTDEHGTIRVNDLTPGNYQFTETKAPKGYVINTIPIKFVIKANQKEVVTINMTNKKDVGSVVLTKTDEKTKELLKGAEFSLQDSEGKTIKEKVVTDEHGTIRVNDLTPGNYQFTETKAPKGYVINTIPIKFVIKANQKEVVTINMTNKKDVGSVVLTKTDEKTKELLKGAEFSLQDSEGKTIKEKVVTDEHGTIRVNDLTPGNYQFTETKAPKGYVINTIPIKFVIKANQKEVVTINMTNKKDVGSVVLTKTDEKTKELLKGAEFSLQDSEGKTIKEKVVTDEHGTIGVNDLTPGNYQFTETKAPKGYVINTIPIKFVIKANQKEVVTINMTNKKDVGSVVLTKTDEKAKELLKGAEFSLQDSEGKTIKEKMVTDEHGTIRVNDLTPGNYQFTETKAPKGYVINTIPIKFVIKENQKEVVTINMTNKKDVGSVVLTKTDEKTKELLKGAEFSLQDSEGKTIKEKVVTDEHGTIGVNDLTPGNYQFTETKAPKGYVINTIPIKFVIKENQKEVVTINMTNKKDVGSVVLTKTDEKTKELLKGAEFSLQDSEGKTIKEKVVTDEHGTIGVNDLTPGNYQFTETKAPKGYVINTIPIKFVIKANQKEVVTINMTNKKDVGSVVLTKTDEKTKELLKGAEFSLQDSEGKTIKEKMVTDEHGTIRVNDLTPGNYQFTETKAPKGYVINTIPIKFVIKANQKEVVTINMTNKKDVGSVVLTKTDEKTKELLKGAEFSLQDSEGKTIKEKMVTDEHGTIRVNDLTPGNYQFTETKAPKGYVINTIPIKFVIKANQKEVVTINMTNKKLSHSDRNVPNNSNISNKGLPQTGENNIVSNFLFYIGLIIVLVLVFFLINLNKKRNYRA